MNESTVVIIAYIAAISLTVNIAYDVLKYITKIGLEYAYEIVCDINVKATAAFSRLRSAGYGPGAKSAPKTRRIIIHVQEN